MREKLMFQNAPHVRQSESVLTIMTDVVIALVPLYIMSFFYYGVRAQLLLTLYLSLCPPKHKSIPARQLLINNILLDAA